MDKHFNSFRRLPLIAAAFALGTGLSAGRLMSQSFLSSPVDSAAKEPPPPIVRQTGAPVAYTVTFAYRDEPQRSPAGAPVQKEDAPRVRELQVESAGNIRHEVSLMDNSSKPAEAWYIGQEQFTEGIDFMGKPNGVHPHTAIADCADAFPEFTLFGPARFAGAILKGDNQAIEVYNFSPGSGVNFSAFKFEGQVTAWIDSATGLPLALKTGQFTALYTYRTAPAVLTLPDGYQQAYGKFQQRRASSAAPY